MIMLVISQIILINGLISYTCNVHYVHVWIQLRIPQNLEIRSALETRISSSRKICSI